MEVTVEAGGRQHTVRADWVVACDGGRSAVRELLGLQFQGMQYEGRYVIVDIEQDTQRPVERLVWFDPPSNPGSTILMHRQPDNVWRIDYQVDDGVDTEEAIKPENVLPRVQSHLDMIGETAPWKPLWISIYNAKCLTLGSYRHGRVLFAGDSVKVVKIGAGGHADPHEQIRQHYGAQPGFVYVIRPDGYVMGRWHGADACASALSTLAPFHA